MTLSVRIFSIMTRSIMTLNQGLITNSSISSLKMMKLSIRKFTTMTFRIITAA